MPLQIHLMTNGVMKRNDKKGSTGGCHRRSKKMILKLVGDENQVVRRKAPIIMYLVACHAQSRQEHS
jgi:hypothetical protein